MQLSLDKLKNQKNLLAFSAGIDSTALFFIMMESNIEFDVATVDYNQREQSKQEVSYAQELAQNHNKILYSQSVHLDPSNFEANARSIRYKFFEELIKKHSYQNLITAHQLDDKLEWFFMQLSKGAGVVELLGYEAEEKRENYTIHRPLINTTKDELLTYLHEKEIKYFVDESNQDTKYKRNLFRQKWSKEFLELYKSGVKKSFEYLKNDADELLKVEIIYHDKELYILKNQKNNLKNIRAIDKIIKKLGILLSKDTKLEILRQKECVISHKIVVALTDEKIFIAPYIKKTLPKEFKEKCRSEKIPPKIRPYLYSLTLQQP